MRKYSINRLVAYLVLLGIAPLPSVGNALDLTIVPRFQAGVTDYEFEQKPYKYPNANGRLTTNKGFKLVSIMPFAGGGATLFANRFFVDFYVQKSFSASDAATNPLEAKSFEDAGIPSLDNIIYSEFDREEFSFSVGYALGKQWAFFGGYREAKTDFADTLTIDENLTVEGTSVKLRGSGKRNTAFKQDGYFFGGAYAFNIGKRVMITLNAALAVLDGKYGSDGSVTLTSPDAPDLEVPVDLGNKHDGDTIGLNLGAALKGRMNEKFGYTLGVNGYSYNFDAKSSEENPAPDISEKVLRFSAGLSYQF